MVYQISGSLGGLEYLGAPAPVEMSFMAWIWSFVTISRVLVVLLVASNLKSFPLIWHLRIVNAFRFILNSQRPATPIGPEDLFLPIITTSHAPIMEVDFNGHKSNSSYFSDIDIARTHLVCTLFAKGIAHFRGGTAAITGSKKPLFGLALGAVSCSFKREIKPYETYELWSRILSWDEKWIYVVTHFVRKGAVMPRKYTLYPQQNCEAQEQLRRRGSDLSTFSEGGNDAVIATALSKCVFKSGRRTVSPTVMLLESGLLPTEESPEKHTNEGPVSFSCSSSDSGIDMGSDSEEDESPLASIERERERGMKVASALAGKAQKDLEDEFTADNDALGRHSDGFGMVGVVSTLAQLAHLPACKGIL